MTILNYTKVTERGYFDIHYTGRDGFVTKALLTNQETKQEYLEVATVQGEGVVRVGEVRMLLGKDNTFTVDLFTTEGYLIYSDIIVFEGRMDTQSDYTENTESGTGYVFG
jgi:hypothetical protein